MMQRWIIGVALLGWMAGPVAPSVVTQASPILVAKGAVWKYFDRGYEPASGWAFPSFSDAGWSSGPAQLGYGDGDEATLVSYGPSASSKYVTTYFRHSFAVADPSAYTSLKLRLLRDDGAVAYLNGTEVFRSNMPGGLISYSSLSSGGSEEPCLYHEVAVSAALLVAGTNVLAVEVHQATLSSSDVSFDLELSSAAGGAFVTRGPYLQTGTPTGVVVRWRTDVANLGRVRYGSDPSHLTFVADEGAATTEHVVTLQGLSPNTQYFYAVGTSGTVLAGADAGHYFTTSPEAGTSKPTRVWVLGDPGTKGSRQRSVRDAYYAFAGSRPTDLWLMLGDNAYSSGTDAEYQLAVFDMYPTVLRNSVLWSALGNHDAVSADSSTQSGVYYDVFTLPKNGEAGGLASGTEAYYSFDYGNIHFVCLDSSETSRSATGAMATWLRNDLANSVSDWVIAFWHHPPYTKGGYDSDASSVFIDMRKNFLPILEDGGVDLVLCGHSHNYQRSLLLDGHYGLSSTLTSAMIKDGGDGRESGNGAYEKSPGNVPHQGAVYVVAGSSGQASTVGQHPVMYTWKQALGSVVLDFDRGRLDVKFLRETGAVDDFFTLVKGGTPPPPPSLPTVTIAAWDGDLSEPNNAGTFLVSRTGDVTAPLVVRSSIGGTATNEADYEKLWNDFTIPAGQSSVLLWVVPKADAVVEPDETVTMTLSAGSGYLVDSIPSVTLTLKDATPTLPTVTVSAGDPQGSETGPDAATFVVTRTGDLTAPLIVRCSVSGTATNEVDYNRLWNAFTIPAGSASITLWVVPKADGQAEGEESVTLTLTTDTAYSIGTPSGATITIADSPAP